MDWQSKRQNRIQIRERMPYLLIGMPLAALFVILIPFHTSFLTLILFMMLMNLAMSIYRSPTIALMPDITPERKRTQANGIINFMGGLGGIIAFGGGAILYKENQAFPFIAAAIITLISMLILYRYIKEKRDTVVSDTTGSQRIKLRGELDRTTILLLTAIFFWFVAYQGVESLFTLYGKHYLGLTESVSAFSLTFFSLFFVMFAIPSGWIGNRFGKKKVIVAGVSGLFLVFAIIPLIKTVMLLRILLALGGIFWACININSYPFIVSTGSERSIGTRTGLYYLVSSLAAITSPPLLGLVIDAIGYGSLFVVASSSLLIAFGILLFVKNDGKQAIVGSDTVSMN